MQKLSKRESILLAVFAMLLLFYAGFQFIYEPLYLQIQELTAERARLAGKWQEIEAWTGRESQLLEQTGNLKEELKQNDRSFLRDGQTSAFWKSIQQTAQQTSVKIVRIQEGQEKTAVDRTIPPFLLEVEGAYPSIQQFLQSMSKLPYHFAVTHGEFRLQGSVVHLTITLQWNERS